MTFEELQALFDSRNIDLTTLEEGVLDNASYYGRIFARSGGLSDAVVEALKEQNNEDFKLNAIACDGIEACKARFAACLQESFCRTTSLRAWRAPAAASAAQAA